MSNDGQPPVDFDVAISNARVWLRTHPDRDYLDAAYAIAEADGTRDHRLNLGHDRWPEFIAAAKRSLNEPECETGQARGGHPRPAKEFG